MYRKASGTGLGINSHIKKKESWFIRESSLLILENSLLFSLLKMQKKKYFFILFWNHRWNVQRPGGEREFVCG